MKKFLVSYSWLILLFLYFPMMVLMVYSFNDSRINAEWQGFTFHWYTDLFQKQDVIDALVNSITIALITTFVTTALGVFFAVALHRYKYRFEGAINGLVYLPILIPDILMGLSLLILFSQIGMELGQATIIISHITFSISFVVVILAARLSSMGHDLEEVANDLGATPWQTFRHVTLPSIAPGIISAALLTFTLSIDDFVISFFVSGPGSTTLPLYIYSMVKRGVSPEINALSTILIVVIVGLMIASEIFRNKGADGEENSGGHLPL
ncbi:ABC transporter permease [Bacillus cytotoxicus]|uniref:Spermidine/putrescine ABC transporter, permease protein n=1 Tax=Bacillus cytotoxicus TaxID=580165 RepID=A0AAX2CE38_9BACI|nr:ABC transporter permease [Bacillus cytotoxicus]QTR82941.1 ABC transporter permease [Bacillus cytotoxicus]QTR86679.1 ABC transporter permease [Bacillus cytotoxicus]SCL87481.1 Spermidine/putrescine ABC transporter, permease protein [Bacillus cytotoxicus]